MGEPGRRTLRHALFTKNRVEEATSLRTQKIDEFSFPCTLLVHRATALFEKTPPNASHPTMLDESRRELFGESIANRLR